MVKTSRFMITQRSGVVGAILALVVCGALSSPSSAGQPEPLTAAAVNETEPVIPPEVEQLAVERKVTILEATTRIGWQAEAMRLRGVIEQALGSSFAGIYIGEEDDRPKIAVAGLRSTALTVLAPLVKSSVLRDAMDVVSVEHSLFSLISLRDRVRANLLEVNVGAAAPVEAVMREYENKVVILVPPDVELTARQAGYINNLLSDPRVRRESQSTVGQPEACLQNITLNCDAPLRGGQSIKPIDQLGCTAGFNARSISDGVAYLITAGHCFAGSAASVPVDALQTDGRYHRIGPLHPNALWGSGGDYAMVRIDDPGVTGWNIRAWVVVTDSPNRDSIAGTTRNESYAISGVGQTMALMRICKTGSYSATTSCGRVRDTDTPLTYGGRRVEHLARANYCSKGGDSGGAVYATNQALGIHVAATNSDPNGAIICDDFKYYQGVAQAAANMNVRVATGS